MEYWYKFLSSPYFPIFSIVFTILVYWLGLKIFYFFRGKPIFSPIVIGLIFIIVFLQLNNISYDEYYKGGKYINFLLGPITIALAIPLYQGMSQIRKLLLPIIISVAAGSLIGALSSIIIAKLFGADSLLILSLTAKSVTSPVAMGISESIGGIPSLTVAFVVFTGIFGVVVAKYVFLVFRINNDEVMGIGLGTSAHGIGSAQGFLHSITTGTYAGLAMTLTAIFSSVLIPILLKILNIFSLI